MAGSDRVAEWPRCPRRSKTTGCGDHRLTGRIQERLGLCQALTAVRGPVTPWPSPNTTGSRVTSPIMRNRRPVRAGRQTQHRRISPRPHRPVGWLPFNVLAWSPNLNPTSPAPTGAKAKGRHRGDNPSSARQEACLVALHKAGQHHSAEVAELFKVARSTVYRIAQRTPRA